jgi:hypothetical protein
MAVASNRFECVADPCDLWMVWDRWCGVPAHDCGLDLVGLSQGVAVAFCTRLNGGRAAPRAVDPERWCGPHQGTA